MLATCIVVVVFSLLADHVDDDDDDDDVTMTMTMYWKEVEDHHRCDTNMLGCSVNG